MDERLQHRMQQTYEDGLAQRLGDHSRLEALYSSRFYTAPKRQQLTEFCHLANKLLRTPVSHVNLVTDNRQLVVASDPPGEDCPLDESYCKHVVGQIDPILIANSLEDPLVIDNVATTRSEFPLRSYLGVPIVVDSQAIGAFCVADSKPREWSEVDVMMLTQLCSAIVTFQQERADVEG